MVISPQVMAWLPAIFLTITFLCTFFPWVATYLGGSPVDSQGLWRAISGFPNRNIPLEEAMQTPGDWLDKVTSDYLLMVPYFLLLLAAVVLAWLERGLKTIDLRKIPQLARVWHRRVELIILLSTIAFAFMLTQVSYGFGLERAMRHVVTEQFSQDREKAAGSQSKLAKVKYNEEQEYAKFNMGHTFWFYLGFTCNFLAVLAMLSHMALERRGSKPPPRIVIQY
jgi:hypothetical protein